ncbi:MAG: glutamate-1-semialdehyde-2,1-aminomutase [Calditrichaeota bacterium]|nr:glutamate-1-semialdehyde 2,1-aminomutase [Calditrichota bacterium]RQW08648.1 MAG: glutamate-1-semialdehyde-2,1-aminomutase [Calditrichota bacterium]
MNLELQKSQNLFERAKRVIPGGVNSPVRAFKSVGGTPLFFSHGKGSRIYDADANEYIDYVGSWGPLILGYSHPRIIEAVQDEAAKATSFGAPTELEIELAEKIIDMIPSLEMVRLVNSGTEATMSAIRLARGYTGRDKIIKFKGCYHGHGDSFLVQAGSGATTLGIPNSPGVTAGNVNDTLVACFNDIESVKKIINGYSEQIAALIVEPVAGNMGVIPPEPGFLSGLRELTRDNGIVLIFDEVMTGFRVARGGAQELYGIEPDLTTLGKIIGGGLPVGAYGGKRKIMEMVAPVGPVYQAGTLSGNPLSVRAGLETLKIIDSPEFYQELEKKAERLEKGIKDNLGKLGIDLYSTRVGSMSCLFFTPEKVNDYESALKSDTTKFSRYFHSMLEQGIYLAPSQFEAVFLSAAHSEEDISWTLKANYKSLKKVFA